MNQRYSQGHQPWGPDKQSDTWKWGGQDGWRWWAAEMKVGKMDCTVTYRYTLLCINLRYENPDLLKQIGGESLQESAS